MAASARETSRPAALPAVRATDAESGPVPPQPTPSGAHQPTVRSRNQQRAQNVRPACAVAAVRTAGAGPSLRAPQPPRSGVRQPTENVRPHRLPTTRQGRNGERRTGRQWAPEPHRFGASRNTSSRATPTGRPQRGHAAGPGSLNRSPGPAAVRSSLDRGTRHSCRAEGRPVPGRDPRPGPAPGPRTSRQPAGTVLTARPTGREVSERLAEGPRPRPGPTHSSARSDSGRGRPAPVKQPHAPADRGRRRPPRRSTHVHP